MYIYVKWRKKWVVTTNKDVMNTKWYFSTNDVFYNEIEWLKSAIKSNR